MIIRRIQSAVSDGISFTKILYKFIETVYIPELGEGSAVCYIITQRSCLTDSEINLSEN